MGRLAISLAVMMPLALGAADLAGTWHSEGQPGGTYVFQVDGAGFKGIYVAPGARQQIANGALDGDHITFDLLNWDPSKPSTAYRGQFQGDTLTLTPVNPPRAGSRGRALPVLRKVSAETDYHVPPELAHPPLTPFQPLEPNGLALTPPMGWNSWNKFSMRIDDKTVREIADAIVASGMRDHTFPSHGSPER
jgi:alpha-galactosidase